jgi:Tfp pilus assembly protein PilN
MIEINLLPGAGRKKGSRGGPSVDFSAITAGVSGRFRDKFLITAVLGVIVAGGAVAGLYLTQQQKETTLADRKDKAVADSTRYATFLKSRFHAQSVRDTLLRQVNIIRSIDEDRFVWPHILDEISRALPQYTWLTMVAFTGTPQGGNNVVITPRNPQDTIALKKGKQPKRLETDIPKDAITIRIMGRTVDIQAVTRFMTDLEASPFLSNVTLDKAESAIDQGKEVTQFQLTLGFSRPDTSMLRRVPLSLSVK